MKQQAQTTNATIEKHTDSNQMEGQLQWEARVTQGRFSNTVQLLIDELYCYKYHPPRWNTEDSRIHLRNIKKHLRRELKDCSLRVFQSKHEGKIQMEIKEELLPALHDILNKNKERRDRQLMEGKACDVKAQPAEMKQETPSEEVQDQHLQQIQSSDYVRNLSESYQLQTHHCHELQHQLQCMNAEREQLALDLQQERAKNTELEFMHHDLLALADERNKTMEAMKAQLDEAERYRALCEAQLQERKEAAKILKAALEEQKQDVGTIQTCLEEEALQHVESSEKLEEAERSRTLCESQLEEQKEELGVIQAALKEQKQEVGTIQAALEEEGLQHVESSEKLEEAERSRALCEAQLEEQTEELGAIKTALEEKKQEAETLMAALEDEALKREEEKSSLLQETSLLNTLLKKEKEWEEKERAMMSRLEDLQGQIQQQQQKKKKWYTRLFNFLL